MAKGVEWFELTGIFPTYYARVFSEQLQHAGENRYETYNPYFSHQYARPREANGQTNPEFREQYARAREGSRNYLTCQSPEA